MSRRQPPTQGNRSGYLAEDTIAAIATALGGAVSIVRLSGPGSFAALREVAPSLVVDQLEPRKMVRARLEGIDDALVARFVQPESFTGEDVVEFHLHGGSYIASRLMEKLAELGARQALAGEFSFRAVRNGKMSLSQATAVADLIGASNDGAIALALEKLSGSQNRWIAALSKDLRHLAALGEVGIDFSDQDVDEVSLPRLKQRLSPLLDSLQQLGNSFERGHRLQDGVGVAFVGLPNAGKSSFFNALLGEERSIVSEIPGTTRDVVRERITLRAKNGTVTLRMEDTAGLRATSDRIEKMGIDRTLRAARDADLVLLLVDSEAPIDPALEQWRALGSPTGKAVGILTKSDRVEASERTKLPPRCAPFGISTWITTSAVTGEGVNQAVDEIAAFCSKWTHREKGEVLLTRIDQARAVAGAVEHLLRAKNAPEIELFASDIRQALHALGPLIGETVPDDILGQIFSEFCIGK